MRASRLSCLPRSAIAHALQRSLVVGPTAPHANPGLQIDLAAEQLFHVEARLGCDGLQLASAGADDDRLVPFLLHDDRGMDAAQTGQLLELLDFDVGAVGKLFAEMAEELLAYEFRREKALVPVGDFIRGMNRRLFRQIALQRAQQSVETLAAARAQRND